MPRRWWIGGAAALLAGCGGLGERTPELPDRTVPEPAVCWKIWRCRSVCWRPISPTVGSGLSDVSSTDFAACHRAIAEGREAMGHALPTLCPQMEALRQSLPRRAGCTKKGLRMAKPLKGSLNLISKRPEETTGRSVQMISACAGTLWWRWSRSETWRGSSIQRFLSPA